MIKKKKKRSVRKTKQKIRNFFLRIFFFRERNNECMNGGRGRGRENPQADTPLSTEPDMRLYLTTLRS